MRGNITAVIIKVAERCNLNCTYCYMYNHEDKSWITRPRFISPIIYTAALKAIRSYCAARPGTQMEIVFHGGEPLLIGHDAFARLCSEAKATLGDALSGLRLQTNATLVDAQWAELLTVHQVNVGVSIDGPAAIHDRVRVDHERRGSHDATVTGLRLLQKSGLEPYVLCVIDPGSGGLNALDYFRQLEIKKVDFLLPDTSHDNRVMRYGSSGAPIADYLLPIFDRWFEHDISYIDVRLFSSLLRMIVGGRGSIDALGNPRTGYVVVETDGSIEPLDALRVCENGITNVGLNVLRNSLDDISSAQPLLNLLVNVGLPLPDGCQSCPERSVCGGGYYPHRFSKAAGFNNPSVWCEDLKRIIQHVRQKVQSFAAADLAGTSRRCDVAKTPRAERSCWV